MEISSRTLCRVSGRLVFDGHDFLDVRKAEAVDGSLAVGHTSNRQHTSNRRHFVSRFPAGLNFRLVLLSVLAMAKMSKEDMRSRNTSECEDVALIVGLFLKHVVSLFLIAATHF